MDRSALYGALRQEPFDGSLSQSAVDGINAILAAWDEYGDEDNRKLAYILATTLHESDHFRTTTEYASGKAYEGRDDLGNTQPGDGQRYKGRGFVMITGRRNYKDWSDRLGLDLIGNPDLVTQRPIAARILVEGMMLGTFTGKRVGDYITTAKADWTNARRVVNGTDKASLIAGYAKSFLAAIQTAENAEPVFIADTSANVPIPRPTQEADMPASKTPMEQTSKAVGAGKWAVLGGAVWTAIVSSGVLPPQFTTPEFSNAVGALIVAGAAVIGSYRAPKNAE